MKRWMQVLAVSAVFALPLPMVWADAETDRAVQREMENFDKFLVQGQGQQAMQTYMAARNKYPTHVLIKAYEGKIMMLQNNAQGAQAALAAALEQEPHHPMASALLANIEFRTFKVEEARKRVNDALEKHPDAWELLQISAEMYTAQQKTEEAEKLWTRILAKTTNPPAAMQTAHAQYGGILAQRGEAAKAAEHLGKALAINWHVGVAVMHVQQLEKSEADIPTLRKAVADLRTKLNAASAHPQYAQIKQQVDQQLAPIEAKFRVSEIDAKLQEIAAQQSGPDAKTKTVVTGMKIDNLRRQINNDTKDTKLKAAQLQQLQRLEMINDKLLLERGIERNYSGEWKLQTVGRLERHAQGLAGADVDEALALAAKVRAEANAQINAMNGSILELAKAGWKLQDFLRPNSEQRETLKAKNLPESYRHFSASTKIFLKKHYEPLLAGREQVAAEPLILAYLEAPTDEQARKKAFQAVVERLKQVDPADASFDSYRIIPQRVWIEELPSGRSMDFSAKADQGREKSYSLWNDIPITNLNKNRNWSRLIQDYQRPLNLYPRWAVLKGRAMAHLQLGQFAQAHEDMALAVAVFAWERANAQWDVTDNLNDWSKQGVEAVRALGELAQSQPGKVARGSFHEFINNLRAGRYDATVDFVLKDYPPHSLEEAYLKDLRYGPYKNDVLDAMARAYQNAKGERKELLAKKAEEIGRYSNAMWATIAALEETDPAKRLAKWKGLLYLDPFHTQANIEVARELEKEGKKVDAMLAYNTAIEGKNTAGLTGLALTAAQSRDRLEGPIADLNALARVYGDVAKDKFSEVTKNQNNKLDAAALVAIANRMELHRGNPKWVLPRKVDSYRNLGENRKAIEACKTMIKLTPENAGVYYAILGDNHRRLTDYAKAMDAYDKALELGYNNKLVHYNKAEIFKYSGEYEKALASYDKALEMDPDHISSLSARSEINEYIFDQDDKALADLQKVLALRKKAEPDGKFFTLDMRISNLQMKIARRNLDRMLLN